MLWHALGRSHEELPRRRAAAQGRAARRRGLHRASSSSPPPQRAALQLPRRHPHRAAAGRYVPEMQVPDRAGQADRRSALRAPAGASSPTPAAPATRASATGCIVTAGMTLNTTPPTDCPAWRKLEAHATTWRDARLAELCGARPGARDRTCVAEAPRPAARLLAPARGRADAAACSRSSPPSAASTNGARRCLPATGSTPPRTAQ